MDTQPHLFDVCIVCALPEEVRAFLRVVRPYCDGDIEERSSPRSQYSYRTATITNKHGEPLTLHLSWLPRYGPTEMTLHLARVLEECQPRIAIMTGICAGDAEQVRLGDLVVAERTFTSDSGKFTLDAQGKQVHLHDTHTYQLDAAILQFLGLFDDWKPLVAALPHSPETTPEGREVRCHLKAMASGSAVRADHPFADVRVPVRNAAAIDMEGAAFALAASRHHHTPWLVVKGVCDYADHHKNDAYHDYAARASAAYALSFIRAYVTDERFSRPEQPSSSSHTEPSGVWNVPYRRNPHFTGRDELLDQLTQQLSLEGQQEGMTTRRAALTQPRAIKGLGGIGKTQIAVEYAYRSQELGRYTHTFWVKAASEEALLASFVELAERLPAFPMKGETNRHKLVAAIKHWLEQCQERWLLIFDNADDIALVGDYLPQGGNGSILLTTRANAVGSLATSIEVEAMGFIEGTQLLLRRAQRFEPASDEEVNQAGNIVVALDHFPLALDQAGAYIEETGCSFAHYLEIYQHHRHTLLARRGEQSVNYPASVATTWLLSFQKVQQANPAAAELLQLCAFLAPDLIPEELFREGADYWPLLLREAAVDLFTMQQMIAELLKFSLVKRLSDDKMLSIHRLVQAVQMDMMEPEVQRQWAERVIQAIDAAFPDNPQDIATWSQCRRYLHQAQVCNVLIEQYELLSHKAASLLNRMGIYLTDNGLYTLAESLHLRALAIRQQVSGATHPDTVKSMNNLGSLYMQQTRYSQAEPLFLQALTVHQRQSEAKPLDSAQSFHLLGCLYNEQGRYKEAEGMFQKALEIYELVLGPEHPDTVANTIGLAWIYMKQGNYSQAESPIRKALGIREQFLGPTHPTTTDTLDALGWCYWHQRNYRDAEFLYKRALDARKKTLESSHPAIAQNLLFLALVYKDQGNDKEAEAVCEQSLTIYKQNGGLKSLDMGKGFGVYTLLLLKRWKLIKATRTGIQALRILGLKETFRYIKETLGIHEK